MTSIVRVEYSKSEGGKSAHFQVTHFEGLNVPGPHAARKEADEWLQTEWLHSLTGRTKFTVHGVMAIDVEAGEYEHLQWEPPPLPILQAYPDREVHFVVFAAGGYDFFVDGDEDEMYRHIEAWGCTFHTRVVVSGWEWDHGDPNNTIYEATNGLMREDDEPLIPATPYGDVYPVEVANPGLEDPQRATHWQWRGVPHMDTWYAVLPDALHDGDRHQPIDQEPTEGVLVWRNVDGDEQSEQRLRSVTVTP